MMIPGAALSPILRAVTLVAMAVTPAAVSGSPVPTLPSYSLGGGVEPYPGDAFDWPASGIDAFHWFEDLSGVTTFPAPVVDFTVTNITAAPLLVMTFQIFGNCTNSDDAAYADFNLSLNGTPTPWTGVEDGPCLYHNYLNFFLPVGATRFTVDLVNDRNTAPLLYADVRFGDIVPAIPLPPTALLLLGGVGALALMRRRRGS